MSQSLSRRSFLKCAGSGAVSLAAALLTGVSAAALAPCYQGEPALLDGKAAVELLGYAPAPGLGGALVYLSVENLSAKTLAVGASYLYFPSATVEMIGYLCMTLIASFLLRWIEKKMDGTSNYELVQEDPLVMTAGTYSHPSRKTPFDEQNREVKK